MPRQKSLRNSVTIEPATKEDLRIILNPFHFNQIAEPVDSRGILAIKKDEKIIAYAQASILGKTGFIDRIEIRKEFQRRGLGQKIVGTINAAFIRKGIQQARLYGVGKTNDFYDHTNYKPFGTGGEFNTTLKKRPKRQNLPKH